MPLGEDQNNLGRGTESTDDISEVIQTQTEGPFSALINSGKSLARGLLGKLSQEASEKTENNIIKFPNNGIVRSYQYNPHTTDYLPVTLISSENTVNARDLDHLKHIKNFLYTNPGRTILSFLLQQIERVYPRDDIVYDSFRKHLSHFGSKEISITSTDYQILYSIIHAIRIEYPKVKHLILEQKDEIPQIIIDKIISEQGWGDSFDSVRTFCDYFEYILQTNRANNIIASIDT